MRPRLLPLLLVLIAPACTDDPILAPGERTEIEQPEELTPPDEGLIETPELSAALATVDSALAADESGIIVVDGLIVPAADFAKIPRERIRTAESIKATRCALYGDGRETRILVVQLLPRKRGSAR